MSEDAILSLIGLKSDLRSNENEENENEIPMDIIKEYLTKYDFVDYVETSSLKKKNVDKAFVVGIKAFIASDGVHRKITEDEEYDIEPELDENEDVDIVATHKKQYNQYLRDTAMDNDGDDIFKQYSNSNMNGMGTSMESLPVGHGHHNSEHAGMSYQNQYHSALSHQPQSQEYAMSYHPQQNQMALNYQQPQYPSSYNPQQHQFGVLMGGQQNGSMHGGSMRNINMEQDGSMHGGSVHGGSMKNIHAQNIQNVSPSPSPSPMQNIQNVPPPPPDPEKKAIIHKVSDPEQRAGSIDYALDEAPDVDEKRCKCCVVL